MSELETEELCNEMIAKFSPSIARSMLVQTTAQAMSNAAHNATFAQQQKNIIINTNTSMSAGMLYAMGAAFAKK